MYQQIRPINPESTPPHPVKTRGRFCYLHDSLQTEEVYVYSAKAFVLWVARTGDDSRHLRAIGQAEVKSILNMLDSETRVAPATHRHALDALSFLYGRCRAWSNAGWSRLACHWSLCACQLRRPVFPASTKMPGRHLEHYLFNSCSLPSDIGESHFSP